MKIELTLKNAKTKSYHVIGWILVFFNLLALTYFTLDKPIQEQIFAMVVVVIGFATTFIAWTEKINFLRKTDYAGLLYILIAALWIKWEVYWAVGADLLFYALYRYSVRKFEVFISSDNIIYPSFPKKEIQWNELQNIIIKDGILTIDFKNNKLLQNEVIGDTAVDEKKINEFCRKQLSK